MVKPQANVFTTLKGSGGRAVSSGIVEAMA
jgi:hypothetical protein